jgi:CRISPR-associated exonuclease Cas4
MDIIILFACLFIFIAFVLYLLLNKNNKSLGFEGHKSVYKDEGKDSAILYSTTLQIKGKPDAIVRRGQHYIPVEKKNILAPSKPYPSHIAQLIAYCILVEEHYKDRPPYGLIQYKDKIVPIDFNDEYESLLQQVIVDMRRKRTEQDLHRSHEQKSKCDGCSFKNVCDERIT